MRNSLDRGGAIVLLGAAAVAASLALSPRESFVVNAQESEAIVRALPRIETWVVLEGRTLASVRELAGQASGEAARESRSQRGKASDASERKFGDSVRRMSSVPITPGSSLQVERDGPEFRLVGGALHHIGAMEVPGLNETMLLPSLALVVDPARSPEVLLAGSAEAPESGMTEFVISAVALDEAEGMLRIWLRQSDAGDASSTATRRSLDEPLVEQSLLVQARVERLDGDGDRFDLPPVIAGGADCPPEVNFTPGPVGPDITVFSLQTVDSYGSDFPASEPHGIAAFAVGTTSCNIGDTPASWYSGYDCDLVARRVRHPVITGSMYRLSEDRLEQIGLSWVKHGFFSVNQNACGQCQKPIPEDPAAGYFLGVNCSDPYSATLNGQQSNLSPRSQVNAFTGAFPFPPPLPPAQGTKIERRLQVRHDELNPSLHPDAIYFVEGQYVALDDSFSGNGQNNCSYRKINIITPDPDTTNPLCPAHKPHPNPPALPNIVHYCAIPSGSTQREQPAIRAWKDTDPSVVETDVLTPEDPSTSDSGLLIVAAKASEIPGGKWHYEYAVENVNSDRSAASFRVTIPAGATVENIGFHDVPYHSGNLALENYDGTDWEAVVTDNAVTWSTIPFAVKPNANALRWGTMYNFRFDINAVPQPTTAVIGLFKPKPPLADQLTAETVGPAGGIIDCNNNGIADPCDITCGENCGPNCGQSGDCDFNGVPDDCEEDCNQNGRADLCDIAFHGSADCNANEVPDECEPDCDHDGIPNDCETVLDSDGDGTDDCDDLCPLTTTQPPRACICPERDRCCLPNGFCIPDYPRDDCFDLGGSPDCLLSPCRDGCLIGDADLDGDRDLADFRSFMGCFSAEQENPAFISPSQECRMRFDYNSDGDVDLADYVRWAGEFAVGGPRLGP